MPFEVHEVEVQRLRCQFWCNLNLRPQQSTKSTKVTLANQPSSKIDALMDRKETAADLLAMLIGRLIEGSIRLP